MDRTTNVICPYMKGTANGAQCGVVKELVKDMEGFSIKLCMSRHYEVCILYVCALKEQIVMPVFRSQAGA